MMFDPKARNCPCGEDFSGGVAARSRQGGFDKVVVIDPLSLVIVIVMAAVFLDEALSWKSVLGALCMVGGSILIST